MKLFNFILFLLILTNDYAYGQSSNSSTGKSVKGYYVLRPAFKLSGINAKYNSSIIEIKTDFNLAGKILNLSKAENLTIFFNGGTISNGTIIGNNTTIIGGNSPVFHSVTLQGTWDVPVAYPTWFGAKYDGIYDCGDAINSAIKLGKETMLIGTGTALTSTTIQLSNGKTLRMDPAITLKLAKQSNRELIKNTQTIRESDIVISGGIIDGNGSEQTRNDAKGYVGMTIQIADVNNFRMENLTIKDPVSFGFQGGGLTNFTIKNIKLDYDNKRKNQDGIHINGQSYDGLIESVYGTTNDDMIVLNGADVPSYQIRPGNIERIVVRNIRSTGNGYRGIRLLSGTALIKDILIENFEGEFRYSCVFLSRWSAPTANYDNIVIGGIRTTHFLRAEPTIYIERGVKVKSLAIKDVYKVMNIHREIGLIKNLGTIENLDLANVDIFNQVVGAAGNSFYILSNEGSIENVNIHNVVLNDETNNYHWFGVNNTGFINNLNIGAIQTNAVTGLIKCKSPSGIINKLKVKNVSSWGVGIAVEDTAFIGDVEMDNFSAKGTFAWVSNSSSIKSLKIVNSICSKWETQAYPINLSPITVNKMVSTANTAGGIENLFFLNSTISNQNGRFISGISISGLKKIQIANSTIESSANGLVIGAKPGAALLDFREDNSKFTAVIPLALEPLDLPIRLNSKNSQFNYLKKQ